MFQRGGGKNFGGKKFGGSGGGRGFGKKPFGKGRDFGGPPTMHSAVCDQCGEKCQVPFKPTGDKPVYCNNCFRKDDGGYEPRSSSKSFGQKTYEKRPASGGMSSEQFETLNSKLDRILKLLDTTELM